MHFLIIYFYNQIGARSSFSDLLVLFAIVIVANYTNKNLEQSPFRCIGVSLILVILMVPYAVIFQSEGTEDQSTFENRLDPDGMEICRSDYDKGILSPCVFEGIGEKSILIVGDSHAFQLKGGFDIDDYKTLAILSYAGCPPLLGFSRSDRPYLTCDEISSYWEDWVSIRNFDSLIITARWPYYFDPDIGLINGSKINERGRDVRIYKWIEEMDVAEKFLIASTPELKTSPYSLYLMNIFRNSLLPPKNIVEVFANKRIDLFEDYMVKTNFTIKESLKEFVIQVTVEYLIKNNFLFRDTNHLSVNGATLVIDKVMNK